MTRRCWAGRISALHGGHGIGRRHRSGGVVLMDDDPLKISKAIRISRKCLRIVYQNIVFAIGIKLICLALGALGLANMWLAILRMWA